MAVAAGFGQVLQIGQRFPLMVAVLADGQLVTTNKGEVCLAVVEGMEAIYAVVTVDAIPWKGFYVRLYYLGLVLCMAVDAGIGSGS
jgi:hypothetical protein